MKSIILIALLCATALAVPSKPTERKPTLAEIFREKVAPKLTSFPIHKITPANMYSLLEDNNKPGLREVVDQFTASAEEVYNSISRAADRLVPLFKEYDLNEIIQTELPQIEQRLGLELYEELHESVKIVRQYLHLSDEDTVGFFIAFGIYVAAVGFPVYTLYDLLDLINGINVRAGIEFEDIWVQTVTEVDDEVLKFLEVLFEAINALEDKH